MPIFLSLIQKVCRKSGQGNEDGDAAETQSVQVVFIAMSYLWLVLFRRKENLTKNMTEYVDKSVAVFFDAIRVWRRFCNTPEAQTGLQGFSPVCLSHNGTVA